MRAAWIVTLFLGALFGVAELLSKFKDEPFHVINHNVTGMDLHLFKYDNCGCGILFSHQNKSFRQIGNRPFKSSPNCRIWIKPFYAIKIFKSEHLR